MLTRRLPPARAGGAPGHDADPGRRDGRHLRGRRDRAAALHLLRPHAAARDRGREPGPRARDRALEHARARSSWPRARTPTIEPLVRDAPIVPETKPLDDLLADLQRQRSSMAVVIDEYGRVAGIVTVEDIVEEVVGEIADETDPAGGEVRRLANGDWFVRGHVAVTDLARLRARAAGRHRRLQLGRRLRLRRAGPAAQARRHDHGQRLLDPRRVGAREPHRGGADPRAPRGVPAARRPTSRRGERRRARIRGRPGGRSKFPARPALEPVRRLRGAEASPAGGGTLRGLPRAVDRGGPPSGGRPVRGRRAGRPRRVCAAGRLSRLNDRPARGGPVVCFWEEVHLRGTFAGQIVDPLTSSAHKSLVILRSVLGVLTLVGARRPVGSRPRRGGTRPRSAGGRSRTRWKSSSSSGSLKRPYLRNGKAATSAAPNASPMRWSRPSSRRLEPVQPPAHLLAPGVDLRLVGRRPAQLGLDRVRRALPHAVEPLDEDVDLGAPRGVRGPQRRVGAAGLEPRDDPHRVGDDLVLVGLQDGHEVLAATARGRASGRPGRPRPTRPRTPLWASASATRSTFGGEGDPQHAHGGATFCRSAPAPALADRPVNGR